MIPLMKKTFIEETQTKKALTTFIHSADRLSMGDECRRFEKAFARYHSMDHAILLNSGGSANLAMLQALLNLGRLQQGDAVGFSALTWSTNVMPIIQLGLVPIPVDIDVKTLNVMSSALESVIKKYSLKCFFATNVLGFCGDLPRIKQLCDQQDCLLIEDNCESLGTQINGQYTGTFGDMASFSFFVAHHMSTIEGGMILTNDNDLADMLTIVRANGWGRNLDDDRRDALHLLHGVEDEFQAKYTFFDLGYNLRPTEITGFIGNIQLKYLDKNIQKRVENYTLLTQSVMSNPDLISLNVDYIDRVSNFAFPIICQTPELRKKYIDRFQEHQIEIRPVIAGNMQEQPFYRKYIRERIKLPGTEFVHNCGFYCGNYPELTDNDLTTISHCIYP